MKSEIVRLRAKGNMTIPAELRKKYTLEDGDVFTLVDLGDGSFFVVPRVSIVPKLVAELEAMREEADVTIEELLEDVPKIRRSVYEERYCGLY